MFANIIAFLAICGLAATLLVAEDNGWRMDLRQMLFAFLLITVCLSLAALAARGEPERSSVFTGILLRE